MCSKVFHMKSERNNNQTNAQKQSISLHFDQTGHSNAKIDGVLANRPWARIVDFLKRFLLSSHNDISAVSLKIFKVSDTSSAMWCPYFSSWFAQTCCSGIEKRIKTSHFSLVDHNSLSLKNVTVEMKINGFSHHIYRSPLSSHAPTMLSLAYDEKTITFCRDGRDLLFSLMLYCDFINYWRVHYGMVLVICLPWRRT